VCVGVCVGVGVRACVGVCVCACGPRMSVIDTFCVWNLQFSTSVGEPMRRSHPGELMNIHDLTRVAHEYSWARDISVCQRTQDSGPQNTNEILCSTMPMKCVCVCVCAHVGGCNWERDSVIVCDVFFCVCGVLVCAFGCLCVCLLCVCVCLLDVSDIFFLLFSLRPFLPHFQ